MNVLRDAQIIEDELRFKDKAQLQKLLAKNSKKPKADTVAVCIFCNLFFYPLQNFDNFKNG